MILNLAVLAAAYIFVLATAQSASRSFHLLATLLVAVIAYFALARRARERRFTRPRAVVWRTLLASFPWFALSIVIAERGLWWTQRPAAARFLVLYALANWSGVWCLEASDRFDAWSAGPRRPLTVLAAALAIVAFDGAAFGFTPYGCALSAAAGGAAALSFAIACLGTRSACLKTFAVPVATVFTVAALEGTVRALHIGHNVQEADSREYAREFYTLTPPHAAFVNQPNTLDEFGPALIAINSRGIRGPELAADRADLLLIGDSMIEARQLPWEQTLGPKLQQQLRSRGLNLRVVAHGMRGWSPLLEWNWYLKVGRTLHPRTVMLFFFWNDLWTAGDEASTFSAHLRPDGRPDRFNVPVDSNWLWYKHVRVIRLAADVWHRLNIDALRRSFAAMAARTTTRGALDEAKAQEMARKLNQRPLTSEELNALLTRPDGELNPELRALSRTNFWPGVRPWSLWTEAQRTAAGKTELELQRFAEDVSADGGRLVVVYVPNPLQVGPTECSVGRLFGRIDTNVVLPPASGIQTWLHGVAERHGIELLDPSGAMRDFERRRATSDTAALYLRGDCHWSEHGHDFMASFIADWYQRHGAR